MNIFKKSSFSESSFTEKIVKTTGSCIERPGEIFGCSLLQSEFHGEHLYMSLIGVSQNEWSFSGTIQTAKALFNHPDENFYGRKN